MQTGHRFILIFILFFAENAFAQQWQETSGKLSSIRMSFYGIFDSTALRNKNNTTVGFNGFGYGGHLETRMRMKKYAFGVKLGHEVTSSENASNNRINSEELETSRTSLSMRAYAADAYFGVGVTRVGMDYSAINSGVKSKDKYSGLGYRLELGFDWFLAKKFFLTPSISYTISNVKSDTSLGGVKINNFNVAFGFGFSF